MPRSVKRKQRDDSGCAVLRHHDLTAEDCEKLIRMAADAGYRVYSESHEGGLRVVIYARFTEVNGPA